MRMRQRLRLLGPLVRFADALLLRVPASLRTAALRAARRGDSLPSRAFRWLLLRSLAARCGDVVDVRSDVYMFGLSGLQIGSYVSIHPMCYIDATGGILIGDNVSIAHSVTIMSTEHQFANDARPIREQGTYSASVTVGDDVWIGAGVRILAGVSIGRRAVVGAGAVVTRDVPANSLVVGVPARVARTI